MDGTDAIEAWVREPDGSRRKIWVAEGVQPAGRWGHMGGPTSLKAVALDDPPGLASMGHVRSLREMRL